MPAPENRTVSSIVLRIPCVHLLLAFLAPGVERVVRHHSVLQHLVIVLKIAREAEENRSQAGGLRREVERERCPQAQAADGAAPSTRRRGLGCRPPCPTVLRLGANPVCGDPNARICYRCSSPSGTRELPAIRGCASVAHSTPMAYQGIPADSLRKFIAFLIEKCCDVTPRKRVSLRVSCGQYGYDHSPRTPPPKRNKAQRISNWIYVNNAMRLT